MGEDTVFSLFASSHLDRGGRGYPHSANKGVWGGSQVHDGEPPSQVRTGGAPPSQVRGGWYSHLRSEWGGYPIPGQDGGTPSQVRMGYLPPHQQNGGTQVRTEGGGVIPKETA